MPMVVLRARDRGGNGRLAQRLVTRESPARYGRVANISIARTGCELDMEIGRRMVVA
jgi:hypothetical protein